MEVETTEQVVPFDEEPLYRCLESFKFQMMLYTSVQSNFGIRGDKDMENLAVSFMGNAGLLSIVLGAAEKWYPENDKKSLVLKQFKVLFLKAIDSLSYLDDEVYRNEMKWSIYGTGQVDLHRKQRKFERLWRTKSLEVCSFIVQINCLINQETKVIFQLPKSQLSNTLMSHQILGVFIDFLRSFFDELLRARIDVSQETEVFAVLTVSSIEVKTKSISSEMDRIEEVREGLCFLLTFLGDEPLQQKFEKVEKLWVDIEVIANKAGEICYMIFSDKANGDFSQALSELLQKIELTIENIKEFVYTAQPQMSKVLRTDDFAPDYAISIIERVQESLENKAELIHPLKNEIEMVVKEFMSLKYFNMTLKKGFVKNEGNWKYLTSGLTDIIDVAEYLISCFEVHGSPLWYYKFRLSHILEEIKLVKMKIDDINPINKCDDGPVEDDVESYDGKLSQGDSSIPSRIMVERVHETTIRGQLIGGEQKLKLISIVGMPGLGKTTLAKKLCNEPAVLAKFYPCGWCCVSRAYNYKKMLLDILTSIQILDDEMKEKSEGDLAESLYQTLKGSGYLIVLDDIWNTNPWDDCQLCFPDDGSGSRIIFTSRVEDLQLQGKPHTRYKLPFLSPDDSWNLLRHNVFQNGECLADFENVGKIIAERCQGLPLVVNLIAGFLQTKERKLTLWEEFSKKSGAYFAAEQNMGEMILEDIYEHLPHSLKTCMMYCAGFQEQNEIKVQKLTRLWVAEGLIKKTSQGSFEKAAEISLKDLINRSLVIAVDRSANGRIKTCRLHSWLHDFFLRKAREGNFLKVVDGPFSVYESHHRLALDDPTYSDFIAVRPFSPHVRSLLCPSIKMMSDLSHVFNGLKLLNVLDLERTDLAFFPTGISRLILLKYLAVGGRFQTIPSSIGSLWKLETLVVKAPLSCVPYAILGMIKLKHLLIESSNATLASLYEHNALNLHTVQTLGTVRITSPQDMNVLRCFQNLREMKCTYSANGTGFVYRFDVLNQLEILHVSLMTSGKPSTFSFPPALKQLTLSKFRIPWKGMSVLAKALPILQVLRLVDDAFKGVEWDMDIDEVEFPELKFLKLRDLGISRWNISSAADAFPKLERVVIKYCKNLEKIPSSFAENTKLCLIDLQGCSKAAEDSAFQIKEGQHDYGNEKFDVLVRLANESQYQYSRYYKSVFGRV